MDKKLDWIKWHFQQQFHIQLDRQNSRRCNFATNYNGQQIQMWTYVWNQSIQYLNKLHTFESLFTKHGILNWTIEKNQGEKLKQTKTKIIQNRDFFPKNSIPRSVNFQNILRWKHLLKIMQIFQETQECSQDLREIFREN